MGSENIPTLDKRGYGSGRVVINFMDGRQSSYNNVTNLSLGHIWVFIKYADKSRIQVPIITVREICEESTVFVRSIKTEE